MLMNSILGMSTTTPTTDFRHSDFFVVLFISACFGCTAITVDAVVPILPHLAAGLKISPALAQQSLTALFVAIGLGQIFFGPLSDHSGRRPSLLAGCILLFIGSIICILAPNLDILLVGRFCQGLGTAATVAVGRSILRDLYHGVQLASMFSRCFAVMSVVPILSAVLGYYSATWFSWRATFGVHLIFVSMLLVLVLFRFRETIALRNPTALQPRTLWHCAATVLRHPQSRMFIIVQLLINFAMFGYVISSQRIFFEAYEVTGVWFSVAYGICGFGAFAGPMTNQYLCKKYGIVVAMVIVNITLVVVTLVGLLTALADLLGPISFTCLIFIFIMAVISNVSNTSTLVMDPQGKIAGMASSLLGTITFSLGAGGGALCAYFYGNDPQRLFGGVLVLGLLALALVIKWHYTPREVEA